MGNKKINNILKLKVVWEKKGYRELKTTYYFYLNVTMQ